MYGETVGRKFKEWFYMIKNKTEIKNNKITVDISFNCKCLNIHVL